MGTDTATTYANRFAGLGPVDRTVYQAGAPISFGDAELMALSRDTGWWLQPLANDYSDIRQHLLILYSIAKWVNWPDARHSHFPKCPEPPLCLEVGVRLAVSTIAILCAMRETGGRLISLEIDDGTNGDRENYAAKARAIVERAGLSQWWDLRVINSNDFDATTLAKPLDLLWIDGAHDESQVRLDIEHFSGLVRPNGMMLLHDYFSTAGPCDPPVQGPWFSYVSLPVDELRNSGEWEFCVLPFGFGLTIGRRVTLRASKSGGE